MTAGFFPGTLMPDPDWWQALWPEPGQVLAGLGVTPGIETAVDLCCGDGLFTVPLLGLARHVIAIDIDPGMLARARGKTALPGGAGSSEFLAGDADDVARLVQRPADIVLIANTFHGVPDKTRLAAGVAAVLKPGGRFIVVNWHRRPREETIVLGQPRGPRTEMRMTPEEVAAAVAPSGLGLACVVELPPYHYGAIFEKPAN
ncbi:MAG: class I SAM-dependent methyltransferase [Rhodospirillales bacterium]|jgi:SAM-dependent methyltransferase|nr:class I SAM-dependent methyltransferase [Rhodospirillales bacterium]